LLINDINYLLEQLKKTNRRMEQSGWRRC